MHIHYWGIGLALAWFGPIVVPALPATPPVYQLTTVAGSDLVGDGSPAVSAQLAQPEGIVIDPAGNLYIADPANHRVRMVTPAGEIATVAGNGHPGFSGDNGPAAAAQLNQPYDVALDAAGNLYIADYGNQRVRVIRPDGTIATVAGNGSTGSNADGGPAIAALLLGPRNLATDPAGNLYISEFDGHRVRRLSPDGTIGTVAGIGIEGFNGDGGPATAAQLASPAGLALDGAGNLYIVDSSNFRIRKVLAGAGTISSIFTQQSVGVPDIQLTGVASNTAGNLYIPGGVNCVVWQLTPAGTLTIVAGVSGSDAYTGDGQSALKTALSVPVEVTLDAAGNLYISETHRVRRVTASTGILNTVAGSGIFSFSGDGGSALLAVLNAPTGLAFNNGLLFISDSENQRVRQIAADGSISTVAGNGTPAYSGDGLQATSASLSGPNGLAFDTAANLYIADNRNNRVRRVDPSGAISTFAGNGTGTGFGGEGDPATVTPVQSPEGVVADPQGNLFISDTSHNRVIRVDVAGNFHSVAGTGTSGDAGDGGTFLAQLYDPSGLALDGAGNLYIADTQNHRIRMLSPGGALSTIAGTGTAGFSGDGTSAALAQLSYPAAIAVDANGNIYIADSGNNRIRVVTPDGNIATIAGTGDASYNGENGTAIQIALFNPSGLAVDGQGNVWVADTGNNRVRMLSATQTVVTPPQLINVIVASSASLLPGPLAPGEIFSIFAGAAQSMGPNAAVGGGFDASGLLATTLGGVQVLFNGTAAPLFYVQSQQINAQVPYEMAGQTSAQLQIVYRGATVAQVQIPLGEANPALFTLNNGTGNAVAVNQDGSINSAQNPAARGSLVVLYATGEGQTMAGGSTGRAAAAPFPQPVLPVTLTMAGIPAKILFAGDAPGFVGLMQINAQVPSGFVPTGDLPLLLSVGSHQSQAGITIAVQ